MVGARSGVHHIATLGRGISSALRTWLVVLTCGVALVMGQPASAASDDAVARHVVQIHGAAVKAQFGSVQTCFNMNSAPCLQSAAYGLYAAAMRAGGKVVALRARPLSPAVRSGVNLDIRALNLQAQYAYDLYSSTQSHNIARIHQELANLRYAFALADQAIALTYS